MVDIPKNAILHRTVEGTTAEKASNGQTKLKVTIKILKTVRQVAYVRKYIEFDIQKTGNV
jgi:hypothetical protein